MFNKIASDSNNWFVEHPSPTLITINKFDQMLYLNFIMHYVAVKCKLLFNKLEMGLLNKSSCLAATLGGTRFITIIFMILVVFCCSA